MKSLVLLLLLWPSTSQSSTDPMTAMIEKYVGQDGVLDETEGRLKFHPIDPHSMLRMSDNSVRRCYNSGRPVVFEAKAGEYIHWGLVNNVRGGGVTFTQNTPRGVAFSEVESHIYYKACVMDVTLLETITKLACDQYVQATHVIINSAFRDPIANLIQGGRSASQHLRCRAIDFAMAKNTHGQKIQSQYQRIAPSAIQDIARHYPKATGLGRGRTFTHLDTRPGRRATWNYGPKVSLESHDSSLTLSLAE